MTRAVAAARFNFFAVKEYVPASSYYGLLEGSNLVGRTTGGGVIFEKASSQPAAYTRQYSIRAR